ncbi:transcriptional regulator, SARP family protein [Deinococcus aluminii]|uniref:Bacterial transcriptional activator domain-containing protein n=1 Tax=Deinococcus aluminii TaxID=1656885 RepID=A0ABP9XHE5_9DEIO
MRHPIFQAILEGRYQDGLTLHAALEAPTGEDDRWAGYCLYALGQLLPAKDLLLRAHAAGCLAAGLELALVLRYLGEEAEAQRVIEAIPLDALEPLDRAYALRERGAAFLANGTPLLAREVLEAAWRDLIPLGLDSVTLRVSVAQLLGYAYALLGREAPALHYLHVALQGAAGSKRVHALSTRAQVQLYAGRYTDAQRDLDEAAGLLTGEPIGQAHHAYLCGLLARAQGQWSEALEAFRLAGEYARTTGESSAECLAELGRAAILTTKKDLPGAHAALRRAETLVTNSWQRALVTLRLGTWHAAQGDMRAEPLLSAARDAFAALGLLRETGWAELHLAAAALPHDSERARDALRRAVAERHAMGSGAPLLPELRLLPQVASYLTAQAEDPALGVLLADRGSAGAGTPLRVDLITLGGQKLIVDGQEVRVGMRRTIELLAYLLCQGAASRDQVLTALWPDDDPKRAANYFHQARHELGLHAPYLQIHHDRAAGVYRVRCEGPELCWDLEDIQRVLNAREDDEVARAIHRYGGAFLPLAVSEWAREERDRLEWSVIRAGLELMGRWSAAGEYAKCALLARRLLDISPCDEALVEYLVQATVQLEGRAVAQRVLMEATVRAERELQVYPEWSDRLARELQQLN